MIKRNLLEKIEQRLFKEKAIIITGARQVGKTTLVISLAEKLKLPYIYLNCDEPDIRSTLNNPTSTELKQIIGKNRIVIIDEAQRIPNIGLTAKLIVDNLKDKQLILTVSSSLELRNELNEPLTGRKFEFGLYPFSFAELAEHTSLLDEKRLLQQRMIFGYYPEIVNHASEEEMRLNELNNSYLFKDIYSLSSIKKPQILDKLTQMLALQLGSEVSLNELSGSLGIDKNTVSRYIELLEKSYVVFTLMSFSRNMRNELKKSRKIYFWDLGIRNAIIKNFNPLELRNDVGALWENFILSERNKYLNNAAKHYNTYFWRNTQNKEIDYIEEYGGRLSTFEIKWNPKARAVFPRIFGTSYPDSTFTVITPENFQEYLL